MKIRVLSVFEGIVYHSYVTDASNPCRPMLEVDAALREGDADDGPLLLSMAEYVAMAGGIEVARPCIDELRSQGRLTEHLGVSYLTFPFWTPIDISAPPGPATSA